MMAVYLNFGQVQIEQIIEKIKKFSSSRKVRRVHHACEHTQNHYEIGYGEERKKDALPMEKTYRRRHQLFLQASCYAATLNQNKDDTVGK